ncbi:hypothetical protein Tco_0641044 [Tanacetum coccineum]
MNDENLMFDTVSAADPITTAGEVVTTANVEVTTASALTTTIDELTLAQTLIEIKAAKPKAVTSVATTTTITRPKARGVVVQEPRIQIPDKSRKGLGFARYNAVPPPHTGLFVPPTLDLSNSGLEEFQQSEFEGYGPKISKSVSEDVSNEVRKSHDAPLVEELVSDVDKSQGPKGNQRNWNNQKSQQLGSDFVMYNKACFVCENFDHLQTNCNYHKRERVVSGSNYTRVNYNYSSQKAHPSAQRNMVPIAVLMKNSLRTLNTAHPKTIVYSARPMSRFSKSAQSTVKRPFYTRTTVTNKNLSQKVNTTKGNFYTARPKAVNTARPNTTVVNAVRENQVNAVKASACWVWRPTKLNSTSITFKRHNYVDARGKSKGGLLGLKDFKMLLRITTAQLQLLSDNYCWKDYAGRDEIKDLLENKNTYEDKY